MGRKPKTVKEKEIFYYSNETDLSELDASDKEKLLNRVSGFVYKERIKRIESILHQRTRYLTVALEEISKPHNASAVLRSCDAFGVQDLHMIERRNPARIQPTVTSGSQNWITVYRYRNPHQDNTLVCLQRLKQQGYKIVATTLHEDSIPLQSLPIDNKLALWFGTEKFGLTEAVYEQSDYNVHIPMQGFVQSLNISASAALFLYSLTQRIRTERENWALSENETLDLKLDWLLRISPGGKQLLEEIKTQGC